MAKSLTSLGCSSLTPGIPSPHICMGLLCPHHSPGRQTRQEPHITEKEIGQPGLRTGIWALSPSFS